jgi:hypothetical protein
MIWLDAGNHLVVSDVTGDADVGVSISAFYRPTASHEVIHDPDAMWSGRELGVGR